MRRSLSRYALICRLKPAVISLLLTSYLLLLTPTIHLHHRWGGNLDTAFAQDPSTPLDQGTQLLNEGRFDEALKAFEKAMTLDPGNPLPHYYAGVAYHRNRQPVPAMNSLNRALSLRPGMPEAIFEIGRIMEGLGLLDKAREAYRFVAGGEEKGGTAGGREPPGPPGLGAGGPHA